MSMRMDISAKAASSHLDDNMMVRIVLVLLASTSLAFGEIAIRRAPGPEGAVLPDLPGVLRAPGPEGTILPDLPGM
jgi:hypothetical protein